MNNKDKIIRYFDALPQGSTISANELYEKNIAKMSQMAFFKALERLAKEGVLVRVAKGLYSKPYNDNKTEEERILNFYFGEDNVNGMYIGYRLYNKYNITEVSDDSIELYSNIIPTNTRRIGRIYIKKTSVELTYENARIIEALEILQNYRNIEGVNKLKFARYARQFASGYNDKAAVYVLNNMHYKKSTIAFMKKIVDMYKKKNTLQQFLSYASKYDVPPVSFERKK